MKAQGYKPSKKVLDLKSRMGDVENHLAKARERFHAALCEEYPFQPGAVVQVSRWGNKPFLARVQRLTVRYGQVQLFVGKQLKSGVFSTFETTVDAYSEVEQVDQS